MFGNDNSYSANVSLEYLNAVLTFSTSAQGHTTQHTRKQGDRKWVTGVDRTLLGLRLEDIYDLKSILGLPNGLFYLNYD